MNGSEGQATRGKEQDILGSLDRNHRTERKNTERWDEKCWGLDGRVFLSLRFLIPLMGKTRNMDGMVDEGQHGPVRSIYT